MGDDMPEIGDSDPVPEMTDRDIQTLSQFVLDRDHRAESGSANACHALLAITPGVDPVLAAADGNATQIPDDGWLINADVAPGGSGVVKIYRYASGGFAVSSVSDNRDEYDEVRVHFDLSGYTQWSIGYEDPGYPAKDTDPCERMSPTTYLGVRFDNTDVSALSNGGRTFAPSSLRGGGGMFFSMDWWSYDKESRRNHAHVNRTVGSVEEVHEVMANIAAGMGLGDDDALAVLAAVDDKIAAAA